MNCELCGRIKNFEIIWENDNCYLTFDNYGVHYAHLLLIPKEHVLNASSIYPKIKNTIEVIPSLLNEYYSSEVCVYEHGNVSENQTTNISIDHAHIHFLPIFSGNRILNEFAYGKNIKKTSLPAFYSRVHLSAYHVLSMNGKNSIYTYDSLPSQAFRKIYAQCEGVRDWDWKSAGRIIESINSSHKKERMELKIFLKEKLQND